MPMNRAINTDPHAQPREEVHRRHVSFCTEYSLCNICGSRFSQDEEAGANMVALVGNASSTAFMRGFMNPFRKNEWGDHMVVEVRKWYLCQYDELVCYKAHGPSRPGCAVHYDCLKVFMRNCTANDVLDRLWQTCVWRRVPWIGARVPELRLPKRSVWRLIDAFILASERLGMREIAAMPREILGKMLEMVRRYGYTDFWERLEALDLAIRLSIAPSQPLSIVNLGQVVSWERGTSPQLAPEESLKSLLPFIRLTIDHEGLKMVERLSEWPAYQRERFDDQLFVVEKEDRFGVTLARFKNGLLNLSVLEDIVKPDYAVWDTPTPPDLTSCLVRPDQPQGWRRFHTVNLADITGLTFLISPCSSGKILGIHAHSRNRPSALSTYEARHTTPKDWSFDGYLLVHVPLSRHDSIISCGPLVNRDFLAGKKLIHGSTKFMIRTRLSGEIIVGAPAQETIIIRTPGRSDELRVFSEENEMKNWAFFVSDPERPPTTLMYCTGPRWKRGWRHEGISIIAPYDGKGSGQAGTLQEPSYSPPPNPFKNYCHSYAPLENVRQVRVFYREDKVSPGGIHCMGMLLDYDNSGQRALGECRVGCAPSRAYGRPSSIAFVNVPAMEIRPPKHSSRACANRAFPRVKVAFDGVPPGEGGMLEQYAMAGIANFWFADGKSAMSITGGRLIGGGDA